jgi:hypothetical protein
MAMTATESFTIGVFKDATWAANGLRALARHGFAPEVLSLLAREAAEPLDLARGLASPAADPAVIAVAALGPCVAVGPLIPILQDATEELSRRGLAVSLRLAGFQAHDARIYETLIGRGGVLIAVLSEPRAADALATLHAYGGGNAAIGAWLGRL